MKTLLAEYVEFLQKQCAHCSLPLKNDNTNNGKSPKIDEIGNLPIAGNTFHYAGEDITNFKAISFIYGLSHQNLASKLVECFKNVYVTNRDLYWGKSESDEDDIDDQYSQMASFKLSFCHTCNQIFEEMYRMNRKLRNRSVKSSLLSKSLSEQFCYIEDQENNYLECEFKWECNEEDEECILGDPLRTELDEEEDGIASYPEVELKEECDENDENVDDDIRIQREQVKAQDEDASSRKVGGYTLRKSRTPELNMSDVDENCKDSNSNNDECCSSDEGSDLYLNTEYHPPAKRLKRESTHIVAKEKIVSNTDAKGYTLIRTENCTSNNRKLNYSCNKCGKLLPSISSMSLHLLDHMGDDQLVICTENIEGPPYQCPKCATIFKRMSSMMMHCLREHNLKIQGKNAEELEKIGPQSLVKEASLEESTNGEPQTYFTYVQGPPFECPKCDATFKMRDSFKRHFAKVHNLKLPVQRTSRKLSKELKCSECEMTFQTAQSFLLHQHYRHNKKYFPCVVSACEEMFESEADLEIHKNLRHQEEIKKSFLRKHSLQKYNLKIKRHFPKRPKTNSQPLRNEGGIEEIANDGLQIYLGHAKGPPFQCPKCAKQFKRRHSFKVHLEQVHYLKLPVLRTPRKLLKELKCTECQLSFSRSQSFHQHQRIKHNKKYFICVACDEVFEEEADLENHEKSEHTGKSKKIRKVSLGVEHEIQESSSKDKKQRNYCSSNQEKCSKRQKQEKQISTEDLERQVQVCENQQTETSCDEDEMNYCEEPFFCRECNFGFKSRTIVGIHNKQAHNLINRFDCKDCDANFKDSTDLLRHLENIHNEHAKPEELKDSFKCGDCPNEYFYSFNDLTVHLTQSKHDSPKIICAFCDKHFSEHKSLRHHKVIVHKRILKGIESRKCSEATRKEDCLVKKCTFCEKTFQNVQEMCLHRETHPKEEQIYRCTQCPKTYTLNNSLIQHLHNLHSEETFQCSDCGKTIVGVRQFRKHCIRHSEIASGVKSLCDLCGKSFNTKKGLIKHKNVLHLGKEQRKCHICGYVSATKWYMNHHMKVHAKNGSIKNRKKKHEFLENPI